MGMLGESGLAVGSDLPEVRPKEIFSGTTGLQGQYGEENKKPEAERRH